LKQLLEQKNLNGVGTSGLEQKFNLLQQDVKNLTQVV